MASIKCIGNSVLLIFSIPGFVACSTSNNDVNSNGPYTYTIPQANGDGWQTKDLNQLGLDPSAIERLIVNIDNEAAGFLHIDSLVIAYNGALVFEQQFRESLDVADSWANNTDTDLHVINSATKTFTSALIGIAIDQQIISSVDVKVHDYFQHKLPIAHWSDEKQSITIENWLNMRSGYEWDEWSVNYLDSSNLNSQMNNAADPVQFLLDQPMATNPGSTFAYSTGVSYGLGRIIQLASGTTLNNFLRDNLLSPLNISEYDYWALDEQLHSGSALYLKTRDMAKFGQLYLDGGQWNGQRVISEEWVRASIQQRVDFDASGSSGYGYQWWMDTFLSGERIVNSYYAEGFGGQFIYVFPELNLVIAMTGSAYDDGQEEQRSIRNILEKTILPTFDSSVH